MKTVGHGTAGQEQEQEQEHCMSIQAATSVDADDHARVVAWFRELSEHVRAVDFAAARPLFSDDFLAFGTFSDFVYGREQAEQKQWRKVWGTIDAFTYREEDVKSLVSPDRLFAVGLGIWDSTGYAPDGQPFDRKGRTTVSLARSAIDGPWIATHTHMSLFRGTPDVSHGSKPAKS
ncbi:YybH family protein [Pseudoroseomonas globiformis]|uniref:YybH family protein n=1 Tax=Teichococcus globiformis TaxID=2307229 RepID=A0ABV7G4D1_9PROT